jgi:hypothetical protein
MANDLCRKLRDFARAYRITNGARFRLADVDPADTAHLESADSAQEFLALLLVQEPGLVPRVEVLG